MVTAPHPPTPRGDRPAHIADLLGLLTRDPGRPRLTWYGDDGERVELSGAVLENWVNKTTNLLVEEFDAGPGARVVLDLPVHWRTVVWAFAVWRTGATVVLVDADDPDDRAGGGDTRPDVVVTTRPDRWTGTRAELVAVTLPALARRFDGDLPPGAIDAASAVMTYGDQVGWAPATNPRDVAVHPHLAFEDLLQPPAGDRPPAPTRSLLQADHVRALLRGILDALSLDGSAVIVTSEVAGDAGRLERIRRDERTTA